MDRSFPLASFLRASGLHVGAAAAAAALRHDLVDRGQLTASEFDEAYAIARVTPGTNLLAMYTLLGKRLAGWRGAASALAVGTVIPAATAGLFAATYIRFSDIPLAARAMQGARAGALAVLLWAAVRLLRPQITLHRTRRAPRRRRAGRGSDAARSTNCPVDGRRDRGRSVAEGRAMSTLMLYVLLLRATVMSFSGFASVPLIREDLVVNRAVLSDEQLNSAIAISQASPGPLGLYVVIVGYFVLGIPGAIAGALALTSPALLAVPIAHVVRRGRATEIRGASSGIVIASCVLMVTTALQMAQEAAPSPAFALLAVGAFALLALTRVAPVFVILGSACIGALI